MHKQKISILSIYVRNSWNEGTQVIFIVIYVCSFIYQKKKKRTMNLKWLESHRDTRFQLVNPCEIETTSQVEKC